MRYYSANDKNPPLFCPNCGRPLQLDASKLEPDENIEKYDVFTGKPLNIPRYYLAFLDCQSCDFETDNEEITEERFKQLSKVYKRVK